MSPRVQYQRSIRESISRGKKTRVGKHKQLKPLPFCIAFSQTVCVSVSMFHFIFVWLVIISLSLPWWFLETLFLVSGAIPSHPIKSKPAPLGSMHRPEQFILAFGVHLCKLNLVVWMLIQEGPLSAKLALRKWGKSVSVYFYLYLLF